MNGEGLVVASDRLEDRGAFGIHNGGICSEAPGFIEVTQRIGEAMECGPRPGAREEGYAVSRAIVRELFGPRLRPFVVCDATQDVAPQRHQFNELGLTTNIEPSREGLPLPGRRSALADSPARETPAVVGNSPSITAPVAAGSPRLVITASSPGLVE